MPPRPPSHPMLACDDMCSMPPRTCADVCSHGGAGPILVALYGTLRWNSACAVMPWMTVARNRTPPGTKMMMQCYARHLLGHSNTPFARPYLSCCPSLLHYPMALTLSNAVCVRCCAMAPRYPLPAPRWPILTPPRVAGLRRQPARHRPELCGIS